jgi:hypothetical protein
MAVTTASQAATELVGKIETALHSDAATVRARLNKFIESEIAAIPEKVTGEAHDKRIKAIRDAVDDILKHPENAAGEFAQALTEKPLSEAVAKEIEGHLTSIGEKRIAYASDKGILKTLGEIDKAGLNDEELLTRVKGLAETHKFPTGIPNGTTLTDGTIALKEWGEITAAEAKAALGAVTDHVKNAAATTETELKTAQRALETTLANKENVGEAVASRFGKFQSTTRALVDLPQKWTNGNVKLKGVFGALKEHFGQKQDWNWEEGKLATKIVDGKEVAKSRAGKIFGRVGGVAAGATLTIDALTRSKTSDGEDRSWTARIAEGGLGVTTLTASALAGRARIPAM